jgi:CubicO group peptidase (beta-lactamase class C family)
MDPGDLSLTALDSVDELFRARARAEHSPGLAYAVSRGGSLLRVGGHGRGNDAGTRPGPTMAFRIASCTKSFTAAAILLLRDRGELGLDDPVLLHLPAATGLRVPPGDPQVTLRMLLTMSAGFATDNEWADRQESISSEELDGMLASGVRRSHPPGTAFEYSNLGYAVLGRVIERVTGQPFRRFVEGEFLRPLRLSGTGFDEHVPATGGVATGYRRTGGGSWLPLTLSGPGAFSPIGGLFSTAEDLSRWAGWFSSAFSGPFSATGAVAAADREGGDGDAVLSRASRREMQQLSRAIQPAADTADTATRGYGFGLSVSLHPRFGAIVSHSGGYPGFSSHMRWHPESGLAVVAFENATYADVAQPAASALELLLEEVRRPVPALWPETIDARNLVERTLREREDPPAARFTPNVPLDVPWPERIRAIETAVSEVGPLLPERPLEQVLLRVGSPAHIVWRVPAERGELECEVSLHPLDPPLIQALRVRVRHR